MVCCEQKEADTFYELKIKQLGLTACFAKEFLNRKKQMPGKADISIVMSLMEDSWKNMWSMGFSEPNTRDTMLYFGYTVRRAEMRASFIDNSLFRDSESLLGWAELDIEDSNLFCYHCGYFYTD